MTSTLPPKHPQLGIYCHFIDHHDPMTGTTSRICDYGLWPSPRAKNFAIALDLPKPAGRRVWSHQTALQALANDIHCDMATLLAMHPIDYAIQNTYTMRLFALIPKSVYYKGPAHTTHSWLFNRFRYS